MRDLAKKIGKKVWLFVLENAYTAELDQTKVYTLTAVVKPGERFPDGTINTDWCEHFVVTDGTTTKTCQSYNALFIPDESKPLDYRVPEYLSDNELYVDDFSVNKEGYASVSIDRGDWKHEHGRLNYLMSRIGFKLVNEVVTESTGDDAYSSIHYFELKKEGEL